MVTAVRLMRRLPRDPSRAGRMRGVTPPPMRDNRCVTDAPERYEQLLAFIGSHLPGPVREQENDDGSILFTGGEPPEVVVRLTETTVAVATFAGTPDTPVPLAV